MRRVVVFNQMTLDGYIAGTNGDIGWLNKADRDAEWNAFIAGNASGDATLLFGRVTYELMADFWTSPAAAEELPTVAEGMNRLPKVVFSRTLEKASWRNTRLLKGDLAKEVRALKKASGTNLVILGSGSIVSQLAPEGLIDEYQVVVFPLVLGQGKTMFEGVGKRLSLKRTKTRAFGNGNVLLCYEPVA